MRARLKSVRRGEMAKEAGKSRLEANPPVDTQKGTFQYLVCRLNASKGFRGEG